MSVEHRDVAIIGAGISGIGAACHLVRDCPDKTFLILERRREVGGTWDLFRYPGVRSDSDMYTFGFDFRPWRDTQVLADGSKILRYVHDTVAEYGVGDDIRFGRRWCPARVVRPPTAVGRSTRSTTRPVEHDTITTCERPAVLHRLLQLRRRAIARRSPARSSSQARSCIRSSGRPTSTTRGKRVLIIGSGATAVTLVPALAEDAAHVTMLQRSPGYIVSRAGRRQDLRAARQGTSGEAATTGSPAARNIAIQRGMYALSRSRARWSSASSCARARSTTWRGTRTSPTSTPRYDPWDQRMCIVPGRRPVPRDPRRRRSRRHRHDRDVHRDRRAARVRH